MIKRIMKKIIDPHLSKIEGRVIRSFENVERDIKSLQEWINYLNNKTDVIQKKHEGHITLTKKDIRNIREWLNYLNGHNVELYKNIKELLTDVNSVKEHHNSLSRRMDLLEKRLERFRKGSEKVQNRFGIEPKVEPELEPKVEPKGGFEKGETPDSYGKKGNTKTTSKDVIERELMSRAQHFRKRIVMNEMLKVITGSTPSTKSLERYIVDERKLCSRTTFYTYLREMKEHGVIAENGIGRMKILSPRG